MTRIAVYDNNTIMGFISLSVFEMILFASVITVMFVLTSVFNACMGWTLFFERLPSISVFSYVFAEFLSLAPLLITSFHVLLGRPLRKLPLTLKFLHLLHQALSSIISRWPYNCSFYHTIQHSLILFNFSLVLSSSTEILSQA